MFLVLASDKNGLSYYSDKSICTYTGLNSEMYDQARDSLIEKDLIAYNGRIFQVLELPFHPPGAKLISKLVQQIGKRI